MLETTSANLAAAGRSSIIEFSVSLIMGYILPPNLQIISRVLDTQPGLIWQQMSRAFKLYRCCLVIPTAGGLEMGDIWGVPHNDFGI